MGLWGRIQICALVMGFYLVDNGVAQALVKNQRRRAQMPNGNNVRLKVLAVERV